MNPNQVIEQLKNLGTELHTANNKLYQAANDKAQAEREYRSSLAVKILELRQEGLPATLITDLARGDEKVSMLKLERDKQVALYESSKYEINALHDRISIGQSILAWFKNEFKASNQINE
jgi:hypothetical protein